MRWAAILIGVAALAAAAFFYATMPEPMPAVSVPVHDVDLANGERLFHIGGCLSCHNPESGDDSLPSGGSALATPVATFYPPNLTPDPETGIGAWSETDFLIAMQHGLSPDYRHYVPAFPYMHYARMPVADVLDLKAYLMSLEPVRSQARRPEFPLGLPLEWLARRTTGLWKRIAFSPEPFEPDPSRSPAWNRGAYLVNGPGHCGECHTPRNLLMIPEDGEHLAGGPHPEGKGNVPSLRNLIGRERYKDTGDLTLALQFGETFGYEDISSGGMGSVQMNISRLPPEDIAAIAEYLVSLE
jgi:mono/diheme cytochrome c family protein